MRVYRVEADDFLSYGKGFELDLPPGMVAITGHNGAGKSSLLDLITWVSFGKGRYNDVDAYVRQGATECRGTVYFDLGHQGLWRVTRTRTLRKKSGLQVQRQVGAEWQAFELPTIAAGEAFLQRLLGVNYEALTSTSFVLQGEAAAFTAATPARRKEILLEVLDVGRYEPLQVKAKERRDQADQNIFFMRSEAARLRAAVEDKPRLQAVLDDLRTTLETRVGIGQQFERKLAEAEAVVAEAAAAWALARERADKYEAFKLRVERLESEIRDLRRGIESRTIAPEDEAERLPSAVAELEAAQKRVDEQRVLLDRVTALQRQLNEAEREADQEEAVYRLRRDSLSRDIAQAEAQGRLIENSGCDSPTKGATCRFLEGAHAAADMLPDLQRQYAEAIAKVVDRSRIDALKAEIAAVGYEPETMREAQRQVEANKPLAERARRLEVMEAERKTLEASLKARVLELTEAQAALMEAQAALGSGLAEAERARLLAIERRDFAKSELDAARREDQAVRESVARNEVHLANCLKAEAELAEVERQLEELGRERAGWAYLTQAYGRDGIPTMILKRAIPAIRDDANRLLEKMFGGRLRVDFITETETKTSKAARDTFEIVVSDNLGSRPYAGWSGAERLAVDLAVRAALSRLLAARAGTAIRTFVMDEGAGALDPERLEAFVAAVRGLAQWFDSVLLVTHIPALRDQFPQRIGFEKGPDGSRAVVGEAD